MDEFGIVYLLPEAVAQYHRALWQKIEAQFGLTGDLQPTAPAHITLKYRFATPDIAAVEQILREFSRTQIKTKWSLKGINTFANGSSFVIFMDVVPAKETRQAHTTLLDRLRQLSWMQWGPFDHADLHYHVTLANRGLTRGNFTEVWSFINQHEAPQVDLYFDNLALLKIDGSVHRVYSTYHLLDDVLYFLEK